MSTQKWMLDVLADLRDFARAQGHGDLAAQLDETLMLAAVTLAQSAGDAGLADTDEQPLDADRPAILSRSRLI